MFRRKLFPYALAACALSGFSLPALAQSPLVAPAQVYVDNAADVSCSPDAPVNMWVTTAENKWTTSAVSSAEMKWTAARVSAAENIVVLKPVSTSVPVIADQFRQLMTAAMGERVGARYRWGAAGPNAFDCSGFVWSVFQSAGVAFERANARTLWDRYEAPREEEKFKFGTLVFFNGRAHVGVVVDERGFYHASRHHGVIYSEFSDYWVSRIKGFRRVPLNPIRATD